MAIDDDQMRPQGSVAQLAATVLDEEARRQRDQQVKKAIVLPDDLLPGVGGEAMRTRDALRSGGVALVATLAIARVVDSIDLAAMGVLAPNIQDSLGVSDAVIGVIGGAFGVLFLAGSIPISTLADRHPRKLIAGISMAIWTVMVFATGLVQNAFWLFWARMGVGVANSYALPVNGPMLADGYPIEARTRIFALYGGMEVAGRTAGPMIAGGLAGAIAGPESWRIVFMIIALSGIPVAIATFLLREPRRGRNEMQAVLGAELEAGVGELPVSIGVAFERLRKVRSFYFFLVGIAALGFAIFSVPLYLNLFLEDEFGLDAWQRGVFGSLVALPGIVALAVAAPRSDALFRRSPPAALVFVGAMIASFGILLAIGLWMPTVWLLGIVFAIATAMSQAAYASIVAVVNSVIPYRLRSRGTAMIGVYLTVFGGFFGAVLAGVLSEALGRRGALTAIVLPAAVVGGALIAYGARYVREDISRCVEELMEEKAEADRVCEPDAEIPAIQIRNLDFAYGNVQILFDVNLDVSRGETLALLGTNGAGKSTLVRVISGLGVASRGVVRLDGRTITYTEPELRTKLGVVQLMGGGANFGTLSVQENMRMAAYLYDRDDAQRRIEASMARFPVLCDRRDMVAGDLSGGQQQMLALAMALVHEPQVLIIDELSLGLAPVVVQSLLGIVRELKAQGLTMIIVEQSLNIALSIADRAIFMEKGQVRFDGPAAQLAERDDLARAVFFGADT
jgi:ABC-type branched-subunit amino acid transport system ATPase component/predicted MFS family arabinose efflux permease